MQFKRVGLVALIPLVITLFVSVTLAAASSPTVPEAANLVITEVMPSNDTALEDPDEAGEYPDWFEIYNAGVLAVDLNGYHFSDDSSELDKHQITETLVIGPGEYMVFYADGDPEQGSKHADFKLGSGETLHVVDLDGATVIASYAYGPTIADVGEYRCDDAPAEWRYAVNGTPGAPNEICRAVVSGTQHMPVAPSPTTPVTVTATITDLGTVTNAVLWYDPGIGAFTAVTMTVTAGSQYEAVIPAQPSGTNVLYFIEASNNNGVMTLDPHLAANDTYIYVSDYTTPTIRINEIMASNASTLSDPDEPGTYPDWIELHNHGLTNVELQGMTLQISTEQYPITQSLVVTPGGYVVFYADNDSEQGLQHTNFNLSAGGETISLIDPNGSTVIDSYSYGAQVTDISEGRCASDATMWGFFNMATPAAPNGFCGPTIDGINHAPISPGLVPVTVSSVISDNGVLATTEVVYRVDGGAWMTLTMNPGLGSDNYFATIPAQASGSFVEYYVTATDNDAVRTYAPLNAAADLYSYYSDYQAPTVYLNEIMADNETTLEDPDEPSEYPDWFELYNPGPNPVDLKGLYLTDDVADMDSYYLITQTLVISADSYLIFYADDDNSQGVTHTTFKLSNGGETLAIVGLDGLTVVDSHTFGAQVDDGVIGRIPDGTGSWQSLDCATPGESNSGCNSKIYLPILLRQ